MAHHPPPGPGCSLSNPSRVYRQLSRERKSNQNQEPVVLHNGNGYGPLLSVKFYETGPGVRQAKPMPFFSRVRSIRTVVFYLDAKLSFDCSGSDGDLSPIRTTRDAMPNRILHHRLQEKPGHLSIVSSWTNTQRDGQARSEANLFNG